MPRKVLLTSGTDPDLQLAGLMIWIHGRQFPDIADYWDGNWLRVTAQCATATSSVVAAGSFLHAGELDMWLQEIEALHRTVAGQAELPTMEPYLKATLRGDARGSIEFVVELSPDLQEEHVFRFQIDQSHLPPFALALRRTLKRFPILGIRP